MSTLAFIPKSVNKSIVSDIDNPANSAVLPILAFPFIYSFIAKYNLPISTNSLTAVDLSLLYSAAKLFINSMSFSGNLTLIIVSIFFILYPPWLYLLFRHYICHIFLVFLNILKIILDLLFFYYIEKQQ